MSVQSEPANPRVRDILLERNRQSLDGFSPIPLQLNLPAIVLTCMDPRVHPADALGIGRGDAVVIRNAGGRVTPEFVRDIAILGVVARTESLESGDNFDNEFELVIMQHTDCGITRLANPNFAGLAASYLEVEPEQLENEHLTDPFQAVVTDIKKLRSNPMIPDTLSISGVVFDVETGNAIPVEVD